MNLPKGKRRLVGGQEQNAGAGSFGGFDTAPATLRELYDEAQAQIAVYEAERAILEKYMRQLREQIADMSNERDFYKAAASKLMSTGRRAQ
jgi:hypothetical protein